MAAEVVRALVSRPDIRVIGAYAHSPQKAGADLGTLCGLDRELGVAATTDVNTLLDLRPDCIIYTPLHFDQSEVERILRAGINIVTSAEFVTGANLCTDDHAALTAAALAGGSTIFGSGMNPGFAQLAAGIASGVSTNVYRTELIESVDVSQFIGDANFKAMRWGEPKDTPGHADAVRTGTAVFAEAVDVLARMLRIDLDEITCSVEFAHATQEVITDGVLIRDGHVGGIEVRWCGRKADQDVVCVHQRWAATKHLDPAWHIEHGYIINISGDPNVRMKLDLIPTDADLADLTPQRMRGIGLRITAAPLVNAIPAVCAAPPGILTYAELPSIAALLVPDSGARR
ncbi:dihydrodipicolinate reductase [Mycobacterium sp. GA-1841]|uniref:dihydrodipicolinate reductase n=1 Tax=Mycobacterium sp. GA-1841 TaxID=1834154 RepID=UPI0011157773|nr:dihydrodipicolinate reductase [Mycobacterium sp. GA-1841]